eukprot:SAG31_NODE_5812_length_2314_cov_3.583920_1_plen_145_part_00
MAFACGFATAGKLESNYWKLVSNASSTILAALDIAEMEGRDSFRLKNGMQAICDHVLQRSAQPTANFLQKQSEAEASAQLVTCVARLAAQRHRTQCLLEAKARHMLAHKTLAEWRRIVDKATRNHVRETLDRRVDELVNDASEQ